MDLNDSGILLKKCFVFFICLMHYEFSSYLMGVCLEYISGALKHIVVPFFF
jgi:hypothetical protein